MSLRRTRTWCCGASAWRALMRTGPGGSDDASPSPRSVDTHIARLRAKLRYAGYDCIKTMRFVGYRFVPVPERDARSTS
jgi:hypothetical protein